MERVIVGIAFGVMGAVFAASFWIPGLCKVVLFGAAGGLIATVMTRSSEE